MAIKCFKDEYAQLREQLEQEIKECKAQLTATTETEEIHEDLDVKLNEMKKTLEQMIDFSGSKVDEGNHIICGVNGRKNAPTFAGDLSDSLPLFQPSTGYYQ